MMSKVVRSERLIEDLELRLEDLVATYTTELRTLQHQIKSLEGPLISETKNAQRENEALIREIDRTQNINREILVLQTENKAPALDDYEGGAIGGVQKRINNMSSIKVEEVERALNMDENNYEAFSESTLTMHKMMKNTQAKRRNIQGKSNGRRSTLQTAKIRLNSNLFN